MVGGGTVGDPYIIMNWTDLQRMLTESDRLTAYWELGADIDASASSELDGGAGWTPVGTDAVRFTGNFNGNRYVISDLYIDRAATDYVGFFGYVSGATISNTGLADVNITGKGNVAALFGESRDGSVDYCWSTGSISGTQSSGGLCGDVGQVVATSVSNCWSSCTVYGSIEAGGFVGTNRSTITNCYSYGAVSCGTATIGGLCGINYGGTFTSCYYDSDLSGQSDTGKGTPKTTSQMFTQATYIDWDFSDANDIWSITAGLGYPFLQATGASYSGTTTNVHFVFGKDVNVPGDNVFAFGKNFNDSNDNCFVVGFNSINLKVTYEGIFGTLKNEADPCFVDSDAYSVTDTNEANWQTAYGWGDHSEEGYLTDVNVSADINDTNIANWNTSYDHSQTTTGNPHDINYVRIGLSLEQVIDWTAATQDFNTTGTLKAGAITGTGGILTGAFVGTTVAPLVVRNTNAYADPWTQYSQIWLDSAGAAMASIRNDGSFEMGGAQGIMKPKSIASFAGSATNLHCYSQFRLQTDKQLRFREDTLNIYSSATGVLDIVAPTLAITGLATISSTLGVTGLITATSGIATPKGAITLGVGVTTFAVTKSFHVITGDGGGNTVTTITGGVDGQILRLLFVDALVVITDTDAHTANTVDLSAAFTSSDDAVLTLISDGTSFYEVSRSIN